MRRHWSERFGAIALATWFALAGVQPGGSVACGMHQADGVRGGAGSMAHGATGRAGHAAHGAATVAHAGHMMASTDGSTASDDTPIAPENDANRPTQPAHQHHSCDCSCPGNCCYAPALVANTKQPALASLAQFAERPSAFVRSIGREWTDFILPFPTPPPAALT